MLLFLAVYLFDCCRQAGFSSKKEIILYKIRHSQHDTIHRDERLDFDAAIKEAKQHYEYS